MGDGRGGDDAAANDATTADSTRDVGTARYVFTVGFRVTAGTPDVTVEPADFETTFYREADRPGSEGWLFFRDNLWRGDLADEAHFRDLTEEALDVQVSEVSFRELQTDEAYLAELKTTIAEDLDLFNADTVTEVLSKYLGSSIRVQ